jgi:3-dehydroquinate synthetase
MMAAAYLAQEMRRIEPDVVDLHRDVLDALGLPVRGTFDIDLLERAWVRDKKYREGVRFVLLAAVGKAEAGVRASKPALARAVERLAE